MANRIYVINNSSSLKSYDCRNTNYRYIFLNIRKGDGSESLVNEDLSNLIYTDKTYSQIIRDEEGLSAVLLNKEIVKIPSDEQLNTFEGRISYIEDLLFINTKTIKKEDGSPYNFTITKVAGVWSVGYGDCYVFNFNSYKNTEFTITPQTGSFSRFAFLKSASPVEGNSADFCNGQSVIEITQESKFIVPNDCNYLYVLNVQREVDYYPTSMEVIAGGVAPEPEEDIPDTLDVENKYVKAYLSTKYDCSDYTYTHVTDFVTIQQTSRKDYSEAIKISWNNLNDSTGVQLCYSDNNLFNN